MVFQVLEVALPAMLAVLYVHRARTLERRGQAVPVWRQACFLAALVVLVAATAPPLGTESEELLWAHMTQHLLLSDLAALLIVLGVTGPMIRPLLAAPGLRLLRPLFHPVPALIIWVASFLVWHLPVLYEGAVENQFVHFLEHATFIGGGIVKWMSLVGPLPAPAWFGNAARVIYVLVAHLTVAAIGNVYMWAGSTFYDTYAASAAARGTDPLSDQSVAGAIMTTEGMLMTIGLLGWLMLRWARQDIERQELLELAQEHGVELDDARARRAVAAGAGARLREQILSGRSVASKP